MNALGVITGNVDVMAGSNGVYGGVFRVGDATGLLNPVGATPKTLTVNGSVSGPITMLVDLANGNSNYIKVSGSTANASISLTGALSNPNNLLWTVPNRTLVYSNASIPLTLASDELLSGASRYGVYDYVPTSGNNGIAQQLKLGLVASPANQISALVTALNTSFFQDASALLGSPANPAPNTWHGGIWSRGDGAEVTTETTSTGGGAFSSADTRFQTSLGGVQAEAAYAIPLPYNFFLTPSAAVFDSNTGINNLYASPLAAPNTWFTFDNLNNTLLRVGGRLGMNYTFNDNLLVQPYLSGNFWHEFDGSTTTNFYQVSTAGLSTLPGIYSNGVGTFGQFAIGFSTQSPKSGFTSFVEADLQTGSNLQGWGLTAGLRYSY
jgi:hypothetical protein